jgi:hypothetical protein
MADEERDEPLTATAGTDLEGSDAGTADQVVGTAGWKAASGAAQLEHEQAERDQAEALAARAGAGGDASGAGESGPGGTPNYGTSGQEGQGADSADRPPGGSG